MWRLAWGWVPGTKSDGGNLNAYKHMKLSCQVPSVWEAGNGGNKIKQHRHESKKMACQGLQLSMK